MSFGPIVFEKSGENYLLNLCTEDDKHYVQAYNGVPYRAHNLISTAKMEN